MNLFSLFFFCGSVLSLSVHTESLSHLREMGVLEGPMVQRNARKGKETMAVLWRRAPHLNRLTTTTIVVGVIGGVAMIGVFFLGILLVIRKQRERRKLRDVIQQSTPNFGMVRFPTADNTTPMPDSFAPQSKERPYYAYQHLPGFPSAPQPARSQGGSTESAWFMDAADDPRNVQPRRAKTPSVRRTPSTPGSRQKVDAEKQSTTQARRSESDSTPPSGPLPKPRPRNLPPPLPQPTHQPARPSSPILFRQPEDAVVKQSTTQARTRSESDSTPPSGPLPKPRPRNLPPPLPQPTHQPARPPSPILFRQPEDAVMMAPRPRQSSLPRPSRPNVIIPVPPVASRRHVTSASEDTGLASRFSISPVARSFPSRLTGSSPPSSNRSSRGRHTRINGLGGSLSGLVHLRSDSTAPDVPTDVTSI
ncbi:hypothetical protein DFH09DRAFT_1310221 [Mycena vulgaris]|nr:hypothetical protein DFH09DRAFT_1310221 [Mycena vulgaris]